jgi:hypothetical protein
MNIEGLSIRACSSTQLAIHAESVVLRGDVNYRVSTYYTLRCNVWELSNKETYIRRHDHKNVSDSARDSILKAFEALAKQWLINNPDELIRGEHRQISEAIARNKARIEATKQELEGEENDLKALQNSLEAFEWSHKRLYPTPTPTNP